MPHDDDFVRRGEIEHRPHLLIEQVGIEMIGGQFGDPAPERLMLVFEGGKFPVGGVDLFRQLYPSEQSPVAFDQVIGKVSGQRHPEDGTSDEARAAAQFAQYDHLIKESRVARTVNDFSERG